MATPSLLGLLIWAWSARLASTCLCCWPDVAKYFGYDVKLLLGNPDVAEKLERLFLGSSGKCNVFGGRFLEREDMERETGNLFLQLRQIIQKHGKGYKRSLPLKKIAATEDRIYDPENLMTEARRQKQNFSKRLEEVSNTFLKEICSASCEQNRFQPYELANCGECRVLKAPCNDSVVCSGPNVVAGMLVTLVILLGAAGGVWYYRRKKAAEGGESKEQEDDSTGGSKSSGSSEWSEGSDETDNASPAEAAPGPTKENAPSPPNANVADASSAPSPLYQNVPTYQNVPPIPSPPHIWSPPR